MQTWTNKEVEYLRKYELIKTINEFACDLNRSRSSIINKMHRLKIKPKNPHLCTVNENFFKKWSEEMAYVLGYWFADGNIYIYRKRNKIKYVFSIGSKDTDALEKVKNVMKSDHNIYKDESLSIANKNICMDIINLGGCERKSLVAKFPNVPDEYVKHFIRGYFDGDGGISLGKRNNPLVEFVGTYDIIKNISKYLPADSEVKRMQMIYRIHFVAEEAQSVMTYMYKDSKIYMDRKYKLYQRGMGWERAKDYIKWTDEELKILENEYYDYGTNIPELRKRHSASAIYSIAFRMNIKCCSTKPPTKPTRTGNSTNQRRGNEHKHTYSI